MIGDGLKSYLLIAATSSIRVIANPIFIGSGNLLLAGNLTLLNPCTSYKSALAWVNSSDYKSPFSPRWRTRVACEWLEKHMKK